MRFALRSQSHVVSVAPESDSTKNIQRSSGEHKKSRGRYDVPEETKNSDRKSDSRNDMDTYPIIDRIPTAIGYLSDGSDEEWLEEKSRVSRYDITDTPNDDDLDVDDDDVERDYVKEEIEEESNDKYSQKPESKKKKDKNNDVPLDTISRLWSESTDSEIDENELKTDQELEIDSKLDREEIINFSGDETDPIYDGSPKNQKKKDKSGKERKSPNNVSDTSSNSDNLQKMLHYATTSDQVVKEIEEKIKLLKAVAAEEFEFSKRHAMGTKKEKSKRSKREDRPTKNDDYKTGKALKISSKGSTMETRSKLKTTKAVNAISRDEIEMTRSISRADSKQPKTPGFAALKSISKLFRSTKNATNSITDGVSTCPSDETNDKTEAGSIKSGRPTTAMYTKSLVSEDSENDPVDLSVLTTSAQSKRQTNEASVLQPAVLVSGVEVESRKQRIGSLLAYTRNLGFKSRSNLSNVKENKRASGVFFWKKHDSRGQREEVQLLEKTSSGKDTKQSTGSISPRLKQMEVKEMDEYSKATKEMNFNEPDVVQCLRFFQCGSVANQVNTAIAVASCGGANNLPHENENIDDNIDILDSDHIAAENPDPTVEVVLKDGTKSSNTNIEKGARFSCGNSISCQNGTPDEDSCLTEAPGLPLSRVPSIVIDVSDMQLHLDGDSEADRMAYSVSVGGNRSRSDLSITSINVPISKSHSDQEEGNKKSSKKVKLNKSRNAKVPGKGIKIRKIFSRFAKK